MCLKEKHELSKDELANEIIKETKELKCTLEESKLKEALLQYELVRLNGRFNMLDIRARLLVGLSKKEYNYIIENYAQLMQKYPEIKDQSLIRFEYIKSANRAKLISTKGCNNCIDKISKKLDVKIEDLCENCQYLIRKYQSIDLQYNI